MSASKVKHTASKPAGNEGRPSRRALFAIRGLAAVACVMSGYLAWASLSDGSVAGCGPDSGCDRVLRSRWAYWLGMPVSVPAVLVYAVVLGATYRLGRKVPAPSQRQAWAILILCAVAVLGAVLWFVGLQVALIKAFCPYCLTAHLSGALAAGLILLKAPFRPAPDKPWQVEKQVFVPPRLAPKLVAGACAGLAALVFGQVAHQPKSFTVSTLPTVKPAPSQGTPIPTAVTNTASLPTSNTAPSPALAPAHPPALSSLYQVAGRTLRFFDGAIQMSLDEVPMIGAPDAPHLMVNLFDYSCHYCRILHGQLLEAYRLLSNQLAIVSLPMPLDPKCNYTVKHPHPDHVNACEYARLGLAVWRADRTKLAMFDHWIFGPDKPPPPAQVRQFAAQLVGQEALELALRDAWIDRQLLLGIHLYATNYLHFQRGNMPQLLVGGAIVAGSFRGPQDLYPILERQLGLKLPPGK